MFTVNKSFIQWPQHAQPLMKASANNRYRRTSRLRSYLEISQNYSSRSYTTPPPCPNNTVYTSYSNQIVAQSPRNGFARSNQVCRSHTCWASETEQILPVPLMDRVSLRTLLLHPHSIAFKSSLCAVDVLFSPFRNPWLWRIVSRNTGTAFRVRCVLLRSISFSFVLLQVPSIAWPYYLKVKVTLSYLLQQVFLSEVLEPLNLPTKCR